MYVLLRTTVNPYKIYFKNCVRVQSEEHLCRKLQDELIYDSLNCVCMQLEIFITKQFTRKKTKVVTRTCIEFEPEIIVSEDRSLIVICIDSQL